MRRFRVKVDSVTGKTQTFLREGYVNEDQLPDGLALDLEKKGILEFVTELMEPEDLTPTAPEPKKPEMKDFTRIELMDRLTDAGVKFSKDSSKVELFEKFRNL